MSADPYAHAGALHLQLQQAVARLGAVLARSDSLARARDRDELRAIADQLAAGTVALAALLDWIEDSDLPPGLRAALGRPGWRELGLDAAPGPPRASRPSPTEAGEPLRVLVHTADMGACYDHARLDLTDIGIGADYDAANPAHAARRYRLRLRATAEALDRDAGPLEHASIYLDLAGARRVAALLRRAAAAGDAEAAR